MRRERVFNVRISEEVLFAREQLLTRCIPVTT